MGGAWLRAPQSPTSPKGFEFSSRNASQCSKEPSIEIVGVPICRLLRWISPLLAVRPEGANHQWRKNPPGELFQPIVGDRCRADTVDSI